MGMTGLILGELGSGLINGVKGIFRGGAKIITGLAKFSQTQLENIGTKSIDPLGRVTYNNPDLNTPLRVSGDSKAKLDHIKSDINSISPEDQKIHNKIGVDVVTAVETTMDNTIEVGNRINEKLDSIATDMYKSMGMISGLRNEENEASNNPSLIGDTGSAIGDMIGSAGQWLGDFGKDLLGSGAKVAGKLGWALAKKIGMAAISHPGVSLPILAIAATAALTNHLANKRVEKLEGTMRDTLGISKTDDLKEDFQTAEQSQSSVLNRIINTGLNKFTFSSAFDNSSMSRSYGITSKIKSKDRYEADRKAINEFLEFYKHKINSDYFKRLPEDDIKCIYKVPFDIYEVGNTLPNINSTRHDGEKWIVLLNSGNSNTEAGLLFNSFTGAIDSLFGNDKDIIERIKSQLRIYMKESRPDITFDENLDSDSGFELISMEDLTSGKLFTEHQQEFIDSAKETRISEDDLDTVLSESRSNLVNFASDEKNASIIGKLSDSMKNEELYRTLITIITSDKFDAKIARQLFQIIVQAVDNLESQMEEVRTYVEPKNKGYTGEGRASQNHSRYDKPDYYPVREYLESIIGVTFSFVYKFVPLEVRDYFTIGTSMVMDSKVYINSFMWEKSVSTAVTNQTSSKYDPISSSPQYFSVLYLLRLYLSYTKGDFDKEDKMSIILGILYIIIDKYIKDTNVKWGMESLSDRLRILQNYVDLENKRQKELDGITSQIAIDYHSFSKDVDFESLDKIYNITGSNKNDQSIELSETQESKNEVESKVNTWTEEQENAFYKLKTEDMTSEVKDRFNYFLQTQGIQTTVKSEAEIIQAIRSLEGKIVVANLARGYSGNHINEIEARSRVALNDEFMVYARSN